MTVVEEPKETEEVELTEEMKKELENCKGKGDEE